MNRKADVLYASQCILGESPLWHAERKSCFWADIEKGILYEYNWVQQTTHTWKFNHRLTLVLEGNDNNFILALDAKIAKFDLETEQIEWLIDVEMGSETRCNDGASDTLGRLWIGTMHLEHKHEAGSLYCIDNSLKVHKKLDNTTISNGIAWSLDNKRLYFIDSPTQVVQSFIFEEKTAEINFEKNVISIPKEMGSPDGMAIDEEGMLWIAHWGGFGIYRWNPRNGDLLQKIEVPVPQVSSCAFVGENLDYLMITTARENMKEEELEKYPDSGNVFYIKAVVKGTKLNRCLL
ncbi:MAG: SMP-30/gluconolactonase/LRE family protein [Ginsengibacter sp.]